MHGILVDSNVIIDILTEDKQWFDWSASMLSYYADHTQLYINPIIYAEIALAFERIEDLEAAVPNTIFTRAPIPWEAAFLAGKIFKKYRENGGNKLLPLPDFFIGSHATIAKLEILTRDIKPYKGYFPNLKLISPH